MYKVSVVMPTLDRADMVAATIDRIQHQTVSRDLYEVLVVDNNSSDHTPAVLTAKAALYPNLRLFSQLKRGAAATRNVGIREARGEIILFIDDDILAEPNLVEAHLTAHATNPKASIIGAVVSPWEQSTDPFLRYLRDRAIFNPYSVASIPMDFSFYHTGNVSTSRKQLLEVGGFNEEFFLYGMEDIELGYRLERAGCRMVHAASAKAIHRYFPTYGHFVERCHQAGHSLGKLVDLHPELKERFTENGKRTQILKRFHRLYRLFTYTVHPFYRALEHWERKRGSGSVSNVLDQHYYWAVRYHFFLGHSQYGRSAGDRPTIKPVSRGRERIPRLAIERHE